MVEEKAPPRKQGLRGWKAAAAVFGCGTLAAFGVFGVILGVLSLFFNTVSSGLASESGSPSLEVVPEQTIKPRGSMPTGSLDLCGKTIPQVQEFSANRIDSKGNYSDPGEGEAPRSVIDECTWDVIPSGARSSVWNLKFSYEAFVADKEGNEASDQASSQFDESVSRFNGLDLESKSEGSADVADVSHYVHGLTEEGTTVYAIVVRSGDTVYEMDFETDRGFPSGELVPADLFEHERDALVDYIEVRLGIIGPG
ncbi:hypothetical protein [Nocardiopsis quinghaiensis]|uniref:hypothetical protein n=1 Tax=Nocardiopsis quinghaiensis TaxID=464995 RepID=UPI00123B9ED6|nr:hypothetical protein [Nocardiopsis quinghaiensis]